MTLIEAYNIYIKLGLTPNQSKLSAAQIALETGNFSTSQGVYISDNNIGGINYYNGIKNAVKGTPKPVREWVRGVPSYYAKFNTLADSFLEHIRIMKPALIKSNTPQEFAHNLKHLPNGMYYTAPEDLYSKNLVFWYNQLTKQLSTPEKKK